MANPVNEILTDLQPNAATIDSNRPISSDSAATGAGQDLAANIRLLKSLIRELSLLLSWERWKGVKNLAGTGNVMFSFSSTTVFTVNDNFGSTGRFVAQAGRRVKATLTGGTIYGTIVTGVWLSPNTTVTVVWDSGELDGTLSDVRFGVEPLAGLFAHESRHISGGADPFLATDLLEAIVKRLQTTSGPTTLDIGAITDGQWLQRSGTDVIGFTVDNTKNAFGNRFVQDTEPGPTDGDDGDIFYVHD